MQSATAITPLFPCTVSGGIKLLLDEIAFPDLIRAVEAKRGSWSWPARLKSGYIILGAVPKVKREGLQRLVQGRSHGVLDGGQLGIGEKH